MQHNITVAVVMDSLSNLILSTSAAYVSRVLHRLGSNSGGEICSQNKSGGPI